MSYVPVQSAPKPSERRNRSGARMERRAPSSRHTQRRRAGAAAARLADVVPVSPLQRFWDEHAVKSGMVVFYAWFTVVNWHGLQHAASSALQVLR